MSALHPDAALLAAERRHSDLSDRINASGDVGDTKVQRIGDEMRAAERVIGEARAATGEGLRAKARAARRLICGGNETTPALPEIYNDDVGRMVWSLIQDLLHQRALADIAVAPPPPMPLSEMVALYDGLRTVKDVLLAMACQPRFKSQFGPGYNQAGEFVDDLCEMIGRTSDHLAEMAETIVPADDNGDEFAERAHVLILDEINCNGITAAADMAIKLYGNEGDAT